MIIYPNLNVHISPTSLSNPITATPLSIPTLVAFGLSFGFVSFHHSKHMMCNGQSLNSRTEDQLADSRSCAAIVEAFKLID